MTRFLGVKNHKLTHLNQYLFAILLKNKKVTNTQKSWCQCNKILKNATTFHNFDKI